LETITTEKATELATTSCTLNGTKPSAFAVKLAVGYFVANHKNFAKPYAAMEAAFSYAEDEILEATRELAYASGY